VYGPSFQFSVFSFQPIRCRSLSSQAPAISRSILRVCPTTLFLFFVLSVFWDLELSTIWDGWYRGHGAAAVHTLLINNCCHEFSTRRFLRALLVCILKFIYLCSLHTVHRSLQSLHTHDGDPRVEWTELKWSGVDRPHGVWGVCVLLLERTEECIWSDNVIRILNWGAFPVILLLTCIYLAITGILRFARRRSKIAALKTGDGRSPISRFISSGEEANIAGVALLRTSKSSKDVAPVHHRNPAAC